MKLTEAEIKRAVEVIYNKTASSVKISGKVVRINMKGNVLIASTNSAIWKRICNQNNTSNDKGNLEI